jgi:hypothetical protein
VSRLPARAAAEIDNGAVHRAAGRPPSPGLGEKRAAWPRHCRWVQRTTVCVALGPRPAVVAHHPHTCIHTNRQTLHLFFF